ncbi:MAG: hypothetical protein AAGG75_18210 [Bacteroidota bacterium]
MRVANQLVMVFVAVLLTFNASAKKGDKVPAYIIKKNGDRIEGKVLLGSITDHEIKVNFFKQGQSKKTVYKPNDLQGYGYEMTEVDDLGIKVKRWVHYETHKVDYPPKPFGPTKVFIEREEAGELNLYCYYIEVRNNPKKPYRYHYYIKGNDGKLRKITEDLFRKEAKSLFKNYTALSTRVGQKQFLYRNLDRMVRDYNYWTVNRHDKNEYRVAMKE